VVKTIVSRSDSSFERQYKTWRKAHEKANTWPPPWWPRPIPQWTKLILFHRISSTINFWTKAAMVTPAQLGRNGVKMNDVPGMHDSRNLTHATPSLSNMANQHAHTGLPPFSVAYANRGEENGLDKDGLISYIITQNPLYEDVPMPPRADEVMKHDWSTVQGVAKKLRGRSATIAQNKSTRQTAKWGQAVNEFSRDNANSFKLSSALTKSRHADALSRVDSSARGSGRGAPALGKLSRPQPLKHDGAKRKKKGLGLDVGAMKENHSRDFGRP